MRWTRLLLLFTEIFIIFILQSTKKEMGSGHLVPFAQTIEDFTPRMTFRHQPLEIIDGCLKLGHVAIMGKAR